MDQLSNELVWFLFGLILMLGEIVTPGFVLIFFGVGAWIVSLLLWLGVGFTFTTQLLLFLVMSVLALVFFRKYGRNFSHGKVVSADSSPSIDDVRGERAVVTKEIDPVTGGAVEFHGTHWNATAETKITVGTTVVVVERDNLTLKVQPLS